MITILRKIFIKEYMTTEEKRERLGIISGSLGIFLNVMLCLGKLVAGLISGSIAITADALNNLSDAGSSVVTMLGFRIAAKKPDHDHPYGHGRAEYVAGFIVSALILAMAFTLIKDSVAKIIHPETTVFNAAVVIILLASIAIKLYMAFYSRRLGRELDSATIKAVATDSLSDCVATTVVLISTLVCHFTPLKIDGICGLVVGIMIGIAGINACRDTLNPLLGQAPEPEFVEKISDIVLNFDENICGMHDLIVHDYGPGRRYISLHAEVPAEGNILELHDIIDNLEHTLMRDIGCMATVHMDPIVTKDPRVAGLKQSVLSLAREIDPVFNIHDFRVVFGDSHTNLLFDLLVPVNCDIADADLKKQLQAAVTDRLGAEYFIVIDIDRDYT